jgi:hypothetical protein
MSTVATAVARGVFLDYGCGGHVADYHAYLEDYRRLLKPQGYPIITIPCSGVITKRLRTIGASCATASAMCFQQHAFGVENLAPCGAAYALLGQIFIHYPANRGMGSKRVDELVNRLALWLDRRVPDHEDTLGWMGLGKKL